MVWQDEVGEGDTMPIVAFVILIIFIIVHCISIIISLRCKNLIISWP